LSSAGKIYIGTSGWSYPKGEGTWNRCFYPVGVKDELEYYSQYFHAVEINSSFYRPPDARLAQSWSNRVPPDFLFTVKLWQKFTHPRMYTEATGDEATISAADVELFRRGLEPLANQGKLGALLAQFPPSFINDSYSKQILRAVIKVFHDYPLAVELRHKSWSDDAGTAGLLRENNVAWVQIDEPKFSSSLAAEVPLTADIAYFRFHGRNREMWWKGDNETRYKYLYSPAEIEELAQKVKTAAQSSRLLFAFFNNHWKAYAPRNANDMLRTLQLPLQELIMPAAPEEKAPDTSKGNSLF
jgi:uncharacterized protein YecE (DUF72 family)